MIGLAVPLLTPSRLGPQSCLAWLHKNITVSALQAPTLSGPRVSTSVTGLPSRPASAPRGIGATASRPFTPGQPASTMQPRPPSQPRQTRAVTGAHPTSIPSAPSTGASSGSRPGSGKNPSPLRRSGAGHSGPEPSLLAGRGSGGGRGGNAAGSILSTVAEGSRIAAQHARMNATTGSIGAQRGAPSLPAEASVTAPRWACLHAFS